MHESEVSVSIKNLTGYTRWGRGDVQAEEDGKI